MKVVEQFKRRILDLAIRGKLVPQGPNDEPASVLLERIKAEKDKLVKAGKIKKEKNSSRIVIGSDGAAYEKLTSTPPFKIPKNWLWVQMDSISESINVGIVIRPKRYYTSKDEGTPAFRNCNIQGGSIDDSEWVYLKATAAKENPRSVVRYGDVLIARSGNAGNCCVVPKTYSGYGAIDVIIARPLLKFVSPDFLAVNLCAASTQTMLASISRGVALSHLGVTTISSLPMPLPPLTEQKRIVAKVKELFATADSLGTAADGLENAAKRLDKKILDLAIRGKLVPQDPNDEPASELVKRIAASHKSPSKNQSGPIDPPFDIPQSWMWVKLGTITNYGQCKSIDAKAISPDTWSLDLEEIEKDTGRLLARRTAAEKKSTSSKHIFCRGMVLYSKLRTYLNKVLVADMDGVCTSEIVPISVVDGVCPEYLCLVLTSQYFLQYTASRGYGVKMPRVGTNDMRSALIPLPPLYEQKRIVKRVEELKSTARMLVTF